MSDIEPDWDDVPKMEVVEKLHEWQLMYKTLEAKNKELVDEFVETKIDRDKLREAIADAIASKTWTQEWYCELWEAMRDWVKTLPQAEQDKFWCIVANGTAGPHENPVYAQQLNIMRFRAQKAESERDEARRQLEAQPSSRLDAEGHNG